MNVSVAPLDLAHFSACATVTFVSDIMLISATVSAMTFIDGINEKATNNAMKKEANLSLIFKTVLPPFTYKVYF